MRKSKILVPLIWMGTGFLSWFLSKYLLSYFLSPLFIERLRTINTVIQSLLIKTVANMIFVNMADFVSCFLFSVILSYFTNFTKYRFSMFIFGAVAVSLYLRVEGLLNQIPIYSEMPSWALTSYIQGFISLLLIIPFLSFMGCKIGRFLRTKTKKKLI